MNTVHDMMRRCVALLVACAFLAPAMPAAAAEHPANTANGAKAPTTSVRAIKATPATDASDAPDVITQSTIDKQKPTSSGKNGVTGTYSPVQAEAMRNERYDGWPLIGSWLSNVTANDVTRPLADNGDEDVTEGDGTVIEHLDVQWTATKDATYLVSPTRNDPLDFIARVNFALSGQNPYEAGTIQFTLPLNIFKDRSGKDEGALVMSLPEDPQKATVFNYKRLDDRVVVTNVQKLPAGYQGYFDLKFTKIVPAEVVSGQHSDPLRTVLTVQTAKGNTLRKTSNAIDAVVNTQEKVLHTWKTGDISEQMPDSWRGNTSLPDGFDAGKYYYVDWYSYAQVQGNQYFTLGVTDTPDLSEPYANGIIIGSTIPGARISADGHALTAEKAFNGYTNDGVNFYYHTYMAYPRDQFKAPASATGSVIDVKSMKNTVTYTLTADDTKQQTEQSADSMVTYREYLFSAPGGQYYVYKWGVGPDGQPTWWKDGTRGGEYPHAINDLANGNAVALTYNVTSDDRPYADTWDRIGSKTDPASYGKTPVDVQIDDTALQMPDLDSPALTADDYSVKSLRIQDPAMYVYSGSKSTGWSFNKDGSVARPNLTISGKASTGDWVQYATASWGANGLGSLALTAVNGAGVKGDTLMFPAGVTQWRANFSTTAAAIYVTLLPTVTLKSNDRTRALAQKLMTQTQTPQTDVTNDVQQKASQKINGESTDLAGNTYTGADRLFAASQSVWMTKDGTQTGVDNTRRQVDLHYDATVYEASNQTDKSTYIDLLESGALASDPGGTYYDLLPRNLRVDIGSVKADGLQSVRTVDDWRGSGRTMLIVTVTHANDPQRYLVGGRYVYGERLSLSFDATYSWFDLKDTGAKLVDGSLQSVLTNNMAYASNAAWLGTVDGRKGEPDDPAAGNNTDSTAAMQGMEPYFKDLNPNNDDPSVVYASSTTPVSALTYAFVGLHKAVANGNGGAWVSEVQNGEDAPTISVAQGGIYHYRLTFETASGERMRNLVLYDDLEQYAPTRNKPDHGQPQWRGTLLGVDVSDLQAKGIAPVVYYATQSPDLQGSHSKPDLTSAIWSTTAPADLSQVKAIAVDCSKTVQGGDFELGEGRSLQVQLRMRAPDGDASVNYIKEHAHAYNNVYMSALNSNSPSQVDEFVHQDYTKIGLVPFDVNVSKVWSDDDDRDGLRPQAITVQLTRNGERYGEPVVLNSDNGWKHVFENLSQTDANGNEYEWSAVETAVPTGYRVQVGTVPSESGASVTVTNMHDIATVHASGTKTWANESDTSKRPKSITVNLLRDGQQIDSKVVTPDASGSWAYDFGTLPKNHKDAGGHSVAYVYTVKEAYVEGYVPVYTGDGGTGYGDSVKGSDIAGGLTIVNRYQPYGNISITKSARDTTDATRDATFTFRLVLNRPNGEPDPGTYTWKRVNVDGTPADLDGASEGAIGAGGTVSLKAGQTVTVYTVPSADTYSWSEQGLSGFGIGNSSNMSGTVTSGGNAQAQVTNVYTTQGGVQLKARKVLQGRTLKNMQFTFTVHQLDESGKPVVDDAGDPVVLRTAYNDADGNVDFSRITYSNADVGKTYTYRISETNTGRPGYTYATDSATAKVTVVDNADGTITAVPRYYDASGKEVGDGGTGIPTFTNVYKASGELDLTANKVFVGGDLTKRKFTFAIDSAGKRVETAATNADGEAVFQPIRYTEADAGKTYEYTVSEVKGGDDANDIVWDTHAETVTVQIVDNGDGTLQVNQSFEGKTGDVPLVWTNSAQKGGLKVTKHLSKDSATQAKRDTRFPMEVTLAVPKGAPSFDGEHEVTVGTPTFDDNNNVTETKVKVTVKEGRFRIAVPGDGWVQIDGIPGGTSYLVTEVDSVDMPKAGQTAQGDQSAQSGQSAQGAQSGTSTATQEGGSR